MSLSYEEATAQVTAPGQQFEIVDMTIRGVRYRAFKNAPSSLRDIFDGARARGDRDFLVFQDERWSFLDVMAHVDALGACLVERYGVGKGDRVAIGMRNFPEWIVAFAAITSIGAISVSLNAWWLEDELDFALEDCGAKVLICDPERAERTAKSRARLGIAAIVTRAGESAVEGDRYEDVVVLGAAPQRVPIDPEDDASILYTSGTTGRPKGAVSTHGAVVQALVSFACGAAIDRLRKGTSDAAPANFPAYILIVPLFHVTGGTAVMLSCFAAGMKLVMMPKWNPEGALELIEREKITNFVGVPTQSWDLLESPRFAEFDTSSLLAVGGGGAPAPPKLIERVDKSFKAGRPGLGYGMTETNAYGPQIAGADFLAHPSSTGRAVPTFEVEIRDEEDRPLPRGERGEIWFKGPNLIRGYWNRPEASAETIVEGWLRTGDIGRIDEEGFVYVEDRAKDMVLRAGENVYSAEVEAAIYEHPAVYEAAVLGTPHERLGEEVAAVIYLKEGYHPSEDDLRRHVAGRLAAFKVPSRIVFVTERLPRSASGKILKRELRDALAQEATPGS